ncbi:MAG: tail fiber domain-containing protein [Chloracidobacterium sp.]|nr:tail fiber domain-containing protein [Chloracidobacterium sp.]
MSRYFFTILFIGLLTIAVYSQTTEFTYQGSLRDGATAANGNYDFEFVLFDAVSGGSQLGVTNVHYNLPVINGIFGVKLDFGAVFPGANRYLEIYVRPNGGGAFTALGPRQLVNSSPYSIKSLYAENAATANNALNLGGVAANQFVVTTDPRMTNERPPTSGSTNYIQNQNAGAQAASNFNISGNGTVGGTLSGNLVSTATHFSIGNNRILTNIGLQNIFAGVGAGSINSKGAANSFFGYEAGFGNTTASNNSFFGNRAGYSNSGSNNSFFGRAAGQSNTFGDGNAFFGAFAGQSSTTGSFNSFFGQSAGQANSTGNSNSFFGTEAGTENTTGISNSFFGLSAGASNTTGNDNSFFGRGSGQANTTGFFNSFFGRSAGQANTTGFENAFFGLSAGASNTTGDENSFFGSDAGDSNSTGSANSFFGNAAGSGNTAGINNTLIGHNTGSATTTGDNNTFLGKGAGTVNTTGSNNTLIGYNAEVGASNLTFATAIGAGAVVSTDDTLVLGRSSDIVRVPGFIRVLQLGGAGPTPLCLNANFTISTCSSSLRYKTNVNRFGQGLDLINQLKPITFDWKDGGLHDLGLGAEDVAAIEPLLVTYNSNGEVEGVKYDRIGVVLVNAVKEQQSQIKAQQKEIAERKETEQKLQSQIDELKTIVCSLKPNADGCKQSEK